MPTTPAHKTFGDMLLAVYPAQLRQRITPHLQLFHIGLHGPDVRMYYNALTKHPINRLGRAMHEQPAWSFFLHGAQVLGSAGADTRDAALAYLLVFLTLRPGQCLPQLYRTQNTGQRLFLHSN